MGEENPAAEMEQPMPAADPADELDKLRRDIERQIRANQRFLEGFLDDNFAEEEE